MSATIIILPVVPVARDDDNVTLMVTLERCDYERLARCAREWKLTPIELATTMIESELRGIGR